MEAELCIARGRACDLLADLFEHGPRRIEHLAMVEALAPFVPEARPDGTPGDEALAWHQQLLSDEVMPVASAFLSAEGCLGGDITMALHDTMREGGFPVSGEPDHIGTQLRYLAWLSGAEADAWRDHSPRAVELQKRARTFVVEHVMTWLGALVVAIQSVDRGLYAAAIALVYDLCADLAGASEVSPVLAEREAVVDAPESGLRQIADWLARPARCGLLLAPTVLTRIARGLELPRGFGNRGRLVENLLHAAVHHERLPELMTALDAELLAAERRHRVLVGGAAWADRLQDTREQLVTVRLAA